MQPKNMSILVSKKQDFPEIKQAWTIRWIVYMKVGYWMSDSWSDYPTINCLIIHYWFALWYLFTYLYKTLACWPKTIFLNFISICTKLQCTQEILFCLFFCQIGWFTIGAFFCGLSLFKKKCNQAAFWSYFLPKDWPLIGLLTWLTNQRPSF